MQPRAQDIPLPRQRRVNQSATIARAVMRIVFPASGCIDMAMTLAEAASACGVNRSTILRAIKSGRISGQRDELGAWSVEPVELHRVFPPAEAATKAVPHDAQADAQVAALLAQLAEMRSDRDAWREQAQRLTSALPKPVPKPAERAKRQTFWQWLFESRVA